MKARLFVVSVLMVLSIPCLALASQQQGEYSGVYTIGEVSYDKSLENGNPSIKLGPIPADQVPPVFPKSFLEPDGSYAGGGVYSSPEEAAMGLTKLLEKGILPKDMEWHIYELDANWETDVYLLKKGDYRLQKPSRVKRRVK